MSTKRRRMPGAIASLFSIGLVLAVMSCANDETEKLIKASKEGRLEEVTRLLNSGADVNAKTTDGWTALRRAQTVGHLDIVVLLRARGAKE
jgi:ankyrin repeat protein